MTHGEIIAMAREAWGDGWFPALHTFTGELARFAALVAAKEREACLEIAEMEAGLSAHRIAQRIRARGTKEGA